MQVIAHRGASAYVPENTLAAYDLALAQGADVLELDVRAARDGTLVVVHDPTLERTTGDPRAVGDLTSGELLALDHPARPVALDTVLGRYGSGTRYLIDLKDPVPAWEPGVVGAIERHRLAGRCVVQSFDAAALERLHRAAPRLESSLLLGRAASWAVDVDALAPHLSGIGLWHEAVDDDLLRRAHARGLVVRPWTVDDPADMHRLRTLGVAHLITNRPDVAAAARACAPVPR